MKSLYLFLSLILILSTTQAIQLRNTNPTTPSQIWQNDKDLRDAINKFTKYFQSSKTLAQLKALVPDFAGQMAYCSNCTTDNVVVATGTAAGAWSRAGARTTAIN